MTSSNSTLISEIISFLPSSFVISPIFFGIQVQYIGAAIVLSISLGPSIFRTYFVSTGFNHIDIVHFEF